MDFVQAIAFGPRGEVWYGTVGNGWGLSRDGGQTWRNWTFEQLGPGVAVRDRPTGIAVRGDTTVIATADGLQITTDDGAHWTAIVDAVGPAGARVRPTRRSPLLDERVRPPACCRDRAGGTSARCAATSGWCTRPRGGRSQPLAAAAFPPVNAIVIGRQQFRGTPLRAPAGDRHAALHPPRGA